MKKSSETFSAITKTKEEALQLLNTYNPSEQSRFSKYPERCVMGTAPTLDEVREIYGEMVIMDWLKIELNDYQNFVGVKEDNKMSLKMVDEISKMILSRYPFLKLPELMLFFNKLKYGDYGEVYGMIDPVRILSSLRVYVEDRNYVVEKVRQRQREEENRRSSEKAITYQEYRRLKEVIHKEYNELREKTITYEEYLRIKLKQL